MATVEVVDEFKKLPAEAKRKRVRLAGRQVAPPSPGRFANIAAFHEQDGRLRKLSQ